MFSPHKPTRARQYQKFNAEQSARDAAATAYLRHDWEAVRAQFARNASTFDQMVVTAASKPSQKANGYTVEQLTKSAADYRRLSTATDAELVAHFADMREKMAARLRELKATDAS